MLSEFSNTANATIPNLSLSQKLKHAATYMCCHNFHQSVMPRPMQLHTIAKYT